MVPKSLSDFETRLEGMFARLPSLPSDIIQLILLYGPYLVLIGGVLSIAGSGILRIFTGAPLSFDVNGLNTYNYYLLVLLNIIYGVVLVSAFKPLMDRRMRGWRTLFYISLLYAAFSILSLDLLGLIGPLLSFYVLFQIKSRYS